MTLSRLCAPLILATALLAAAPAGAFIIRHGGARHTGGLARRALHADRAQMRASHAAPGAVRRVRLPKQP